MAFMKSLFVVLKNREVGCHRRGRMESRWRQIAQGTRVGTTPGGPEVAVLREGPLETPDRGSTAGLHGTPAHLPASAPGQVPEGGLVLSTGNSLRLVSSRGRSVTQGGGWGTATPFSEEAATVVVPLPQAGRTDRLTRAHSKDRRDLEDPSRLRRADVMR